MSAVCRDQTTGFGETTVAASALTGIKVLDLSHHIAGPYCAKLLADLGADVVKVERPDTGDPARRMAPFYHDVEDHEHSLLFLYLNTGKRSITLDLKSERGREIVRRLAAESDLVVENFSPRVMPSLGLGYEELRSLNRRLVMVSISNFGQTGPYRDYKATEIVEYALGGLMYLMGSNGKEPLKHALHQAQFKAGINAAGAALIALYGARMNGRGRHVDLSIQECVASSLRDTTSVYTYMGAIRWRQPDHPGDIPRSPLQTRDGYAVPIIYGSLPWETIADFLDSDELNDPRFSTPEARAENAEELDEIVRAAFRSHGKWVLFHAAHRRRGFIYGVIQSPEEVVRNPQFQARRYFVEIDHPLVGKMSYPGAPFLMSGTPWRARSPAPALGQHNREIICDRLVYPDTEPAPLNSEGAP